jgi:hypothetical protein
MIPENQLETAVVEVAPPLSRIHTYIRRSMLRSLKEWHGISGENKSLDSFAAEILEAAIIEFRSRKITRSAPLTEKSARIETPKDRRQVLTAAQKQQVLHLRNKESMGVSTLATRFGVAPTTIARVLSEYAATEHVQIPHCPGPERTATKPWG